ncbi:MAG: efflux RND transporter periplasmic adaptor subunit [Sulfurimonas sp.]|uniref:efflux RND transporter periplasmic adaptor subunit n=1 Tax=Sulfurimonas sp. TaxID=2022749 RepID=UPI0025F70579|nr:efflux RND transporter periplasmic adaptor subunit [Sulfurimonas sp.]MCK9491605.1 efflux RND transporter periplasmic adaptor subunit [Sulfurimonas sp.]
MKNLVFLTVVLSLFLVGCNDEKKNPQDVPKAAQKPPLSVEVYTVKFEKAPLINNYSTLLKPFNEVDIVARVSGILMSKNFDEGAYVKKGDTLYEIQKDEYAATLNEAKASLLKAEANFNKAQKEWDRNEYLFKNNAISAVMRDDLFYTFEDAKAEVTKAKAVLQNAQIKFDYTTIKASISGNIGMSNSDVGSYIDVGEDSAMLATITAQDPIYAEFSLPSGDVTKYISQIKNGSKVILSVNTKEYMGEIDFISPKIDAQTDTLKLRAKLQNKDNELIVGSYAEIQIDGLSYDRIAKVPQEALIKTQDATVVYIVKDGTISMRPIKSLQVQDGIAYVQENIEEGEKIVITNIAKLRPNSKVTIVKGN